MSRPVNVFDREDLAEHASAFLDRLEHPRALDGGPYELRDGEGAVVADPLVLGQRPVRHLVRRNGDVYSCSCGEWSSRVERRSARTCRHIQALRGADAENVRVSEAMLADPAPPPGVRWNNQATKGRP